MKTNQGFAGLIIMIVYLTIASANKPGSDSVLVADYKFKTNSDTSVHPQLTLKGTVKNQHGQPLKDVKVGAGNTIFTSTDSLGVFSFLVENKPAILTFILAKMVTVKRSYHPSMLEKSFDIIMEKDSCKYCARISEAIHKKN